MNKILSTIFVLLLTQLVFANTERNEKYFDRLSEKLNLKTEQVDSVKTIIEEQHKKRSELKKKISIQMQEIHDETNKRLKTVLTPEQLQTFEELHAERMERRKQHREKARNTGEE